MSFMRRILPDEILSGAIQLGSEILSCPTKLEPLLDLCGLDLVGRWIEFIYLLVGHTEMLAICKLMRGAWPRYAYEYLSENKDQNLPEKADFQVTIIQTHMVLDQTALRTYLRMLFI